MIKLTEGQEEAIFSIMEAAKQFASVTGRVMRRNRLDKIDGCIMTMCIDPTMQSEQIGITFGRIADNTDFGVVSFGKRLDDDEFKMFSFSSPEYKELFARNHA